MVSVFSSPACVFSCLTSCTYQYEHRGLLAEQLDDIWVQLRNRQRIVALSYRVPARLLGHSVRDHTVAARVAPLAPDAGT